MKLLKDLYITRIQTRFLFTLCLLFLLIPVLSAANFQPLSASYAPFLLSSNASSISGDGTTVVGSVKHGNGDQVAFIWAIGSSVTQLPFGNATDVSYDGSVVVGERYRWTLAGGAQDIGDLSGSGSSSAYGVSGDGSTVIGFSDGTNGREAYRWIQSGGMQGLGFLPATNNLSRANDVSEDGTVVVGGGYGGAFHWTASTGIVPLATTGPLNDPFLGTPNAISANGTTVGGQSPEAWIWTQATGVQLLGFNQAVYAVSADGSIAVGGDQNSSSSGTAFIWDAVNGTRPLQDYMQNDLGLDLSGWTLHAALGVSDDGTKIAGVGVNPSGIKEAWYADITPASVVIPPSAVSVPLTSILTFIALIVGLLASGLVILFQSKREMT